MRARVSAAGLREEGREVGVGTGVLSGRVGCCAEFNERAVRGGVSGGGARGSGPVASGLFGETVRLLLGATCFRFRLRRAAPDPPLHLNSRGCEGAHAGWFVVSVTCGFVVAGRAHAAEPHIETAPRP
ncbi:hypothetical protein GCM10010329_31280 [Streptomyces spiroverticillatus]|uniref:Uncharacterized protein n=1 Tax=Streptomyces finlayi TaxID=67296 RepID=A0A918WWE3_9ACTN|nr:hypothetical protein GCM10010329_31280 [Streptomyces spiroverticillatus]GHC90017.1 hypothetical protein GCM10010334_23690 [Streptomyces finlayi]